MPRESLGESAPTRPDYENDGHLDALELLAEAMYVAEAVVGYGVDVMDEDAWQLLDESMRQEWRDMADKWIDARCDTIIEEAAVLS